MKTKELRNMSKADREQKLKELKMELAILLRAIQWFVSEDDFYETFRNIFGFMGGYWD